MKILQVTLGFHPAEAWGGPVKVVYQNGKELVRRGHEVTVYCTNLLNKHTKIEPGTFEREVDGMRVVYFNTWRLRQWPGTLGPFWLPDLPRYLDRELDSFDIVHLNGYRCSMTLCAARAARRHGVPVVTQPHGTLPVIVNSFRTKRLYDRVLGRMELDGIAALIALQPEEKRQALDHEIPENIIHVIPNGISDVEHQRFPAPGAFRRKLGLDPSVPLILFLARINKKKGTDMLVEAFASIRDTGAHLVIAGPDDGQLAEVRQLVGKFGLERAVTLPGLLTGDEVYGALRDSDLFVLPCRSDTFPFAIVEACLTETPMVVTDRCEMAEMLRGRVAEITPFDSAAFAQAMRDLLSDARKHESYRRNCRQLLRENFSIGSVVDRIEALYHQLAGHGMPAGVQQHVH